MKNLIKVIPKRIKDADCNTYWTQILPKNILLSDVSPKENLIELEDTSTGQRFWVDMIQLLGVQMNMRIGYVHPVKEKIYYKPFLIYKINAEIKRKRCYIKIYFKDLVDENPIASNEFWNLEKQWFLIHQLEKQQLQRIGKRY